MPEFLPGQVPGREFAEFLHELLEGGFKPPIIVTKVSKNGAVSVEEYVEYVADGKAGLRGAILADRPKGMELAKPINVLAVDARGVAAHVEIDGKGRWWKAWL